MKLPILFKRTKKLNIQFWEVEYEPTGDYAQIIKTSGQYGTDKPLENIEHVTEGKNLNKSNATTPYEQAELQARSDWKKKQDQGYKTMETLGITWHEPTCDWVYNGEYFGFLNKALEAALPQYNSDAQGNIKCMLALPVNWNKVTYPCLVSPKLDGCVHGNTLITTDKGLIKIRDIVDRKMKVKVLSYNEQLNLFEYKPVLNWFNNGGSSYTDWIEVTLPSGIKLKTTDNHKYLTNNGWKQASDLSEDTDLLYVTNFSLYNISLLFGTLLGDSFLNVDKRKSASSYRLEFSHTNKDLFDYKISLLNLTGASTQYTTGYGSEGYRFTSKAMTKSNFPVDRFYFVGHSSNVGKRKYIPYRTMQQYMSKEALSLWIADDGSLRLNNSNPHTPVLSISTHKHSVEQIDVFIEYFQKVWKCTPTKIQDKRVNTELCSGIFLNFSTKDTLYILNHLRKYHCKGVEYKYYFPTEGYIEPAEETYAWSSFSKVNATPYPKPYTKYDLEVEDNHNYVANGIVVHNCRSLLIFDGSDVTFLSRTGKTYTTLGHIREEVLANFQEPMILDGEIYSHELTFQEIVAAVKKQRDDSFKLRFKAYDIVNDLNQLERDRALCDLLDTRDLYNIHRLQTLRCGSKEEVIQLHNHWVGEGYEGAMIRLLDGKYQQGQRSSSLLKVKVYDTNEFAFVEFILGQRGVEDLIARCYTDDGLSFRAKMQGTMAQKEELFKHHPPAGSMLTIKHHGYTDQNLPRFPIGIAFRDYE